MVNYYIRFNISWTRLRLFKPFRDTKSMGFLSRFRGKHERKHETELPPTEVKLAELSGWLEQELSEKAQEAGKKSRELQSRVANTFQQVGVSAKKLIKAEFESKDKTYAAVNSVKNTFASRVLSLSGKCPEPGDSYSDAAGFQKRAGEILRELANSTPRQGLVMLNYFKKESSPVMGGMKNIGALLEDLRKFLDYEGKSLFLLEEGGRLSQEISQKLESSRKLEKRSVEIQQETRGSKKALSESEGVLEKILNDPAWKALESAGKERESLEASARDIKFRMGEELSSAKRPLKKYLHLKSGELSKEDRLFLESFVKSPLKAAGNPSGTERLKPFLLSLRDLEAGLKDKELRKLEDLTTRLESGEIAKSLQDCARLLADAESNFRKLEGGSSALSEKRKQAEVAIEETKKSIAGLEKELQETRERAKALKEEASKQKEELERLMHENLNRKVNILLDKAN